MSTSYLVTWRLGLILFVCLNGMVISAQAADAVPGEQWCVRSVDKIEFSGNKVTRNQVIKREVLQREGETCSLDDIVDGLQNIMDLGLFKSVRAELQLNDGLLTLRYIVKEKIFFLPIPRVSRTSDGELRMGGQIRWDNFLGRLHQLKLTSEKRQEDNGRGRVGYVHSLNYKVPRFFGSRYGMNVRAAREKRNAQLVQDGVIYGESLRQSQQLGIALSRWASDSLGISGLSYFGGVDFEKRQYDMRSGVIGPYSEGQDISFSAGFAVQRVHQGSYRRTGHYIGGSLSFAKKSLGSDYQYARLNAELRLYIPLVMAQSNLNIQARLGWSNLAPFGERSYGIGGGELIRGMESGAQTGNISTIVNVEYLSGFFTHPTWRWLVFMDIGNVYLKSDVNFLKQYVRGGLGLRWKVESLTNTDLRLDLAWDPSEERMKPYLSTSLTF